MFVCYFAFLCLFSFIHEENKYIFQTFWKIFLDSVIEKEECPPCPLSRGVLANAAPLSIELSQNQAKNEVRYCVRHRSPDLAQTLKKKWRTWSKMRWVILDFP